VYSGAVKVRLRVGEVASEPPIAVTLARQDRTTPLWYSLGVTLGLALVIGILASQGLRHAEVAGKKKSILTTLLLDPETDSFSLSKFQLFAWTAVSIFSYIYLLLVRSLIQGPPLRWRFTISNPDGQLAVWFFEMPVISAWELKKPCARRSDRPGATSDQSTSVWRTGTTVSYATASRNDG
jgi:hypothetical protein